jgi:hypothetical protein
MNQPRLDKVTLTMLEELAKKARPVMNPDKYLADLIRKMYMSL